MARIAGIGQAFIVALVATALLLVPTVAASADSCGHDAAHAVTGLGIHAAQAMPRDIAGNAHDNSAHDDVCQCGPSLWLPPIAAPGLAALPLTPRPFDLPVDRFMAGLTNPPAGPHDPPAPWSSSLLNPHRVRTRGSSPRARADARAVPRGIEDMAFAENKGVA
jgi:hypothetical protein